MQRPEGRQGSGPPNRHSGLSRRGNRLQRHGAHHGIPRGYSVRNGSRRKGRSGRPRPGTSHPRRRIYGEIPEEGNTGNRDAAGGDGRGGKQGSGRNGNNGGKGGNGRNGSNGSIGSKHPLSGRP